MVPNHTTVSHTTADYHFLACLQLFPPFRHVLQPLRMPCVHVPVLLSLLRSIDPLLPDKERLGKIVIDGKVGVCRQLLLITGPWTARHVVIYTRL